MPPDTTGERVAALEARLEDLADDQVEDRRVMREGFEASQRRDVESHARIAQTREDLVRTFREGCHDVRDSVNASVQRIAAEWAQTKRDQDERIRALEQDKAERDASIRLLQRAGAVMWAGALAVGSLAGWLFNHFVNRGS